MEEVPIKIEIPETKETKFDIDAYTELELESILNRKFSLSTENVLTVNKSIYILHLSCTDENNPRICAGLSNNICEVYQLSNCELNKVTDLKEHENNIINVKFSSDSNILYTGSRDCKIKTWDLRTPQKSVLQFTDTSAEIDEVKPLLSFDVTENNRLLVGGTELYDGDAFLLFWDARKPNLLGGYWESHADDITKVLFHPTDNNKLASGSTDGLINIYNLLKTNEDDALIHCLNTESSVDQLNWYNSNDLCCIVHTFEMQLWNTNENEIYKKFKRENIAIVFESNSDKHTYIANTHVTKTNDLFLLAGSNLNQSVRSLIVQNNKELIPWFNLKDNKQIIRSSCFNKNSGILLTGGEKCILSVWQESN